MTLRKNSCLKALKFRRTSENLKKNQIRKFKTLKELVEMLDAGRAKSLTLARPVAIISWCLACEGELCPFIGNRDDSKDARSFPRER